MRKIYIEKFSDTNFWDDNWNKTSLQEAVEYCDVSVLKRFFIKYFPKNGKILEGGCGLGQYVVYFKKLGYDIEGVDFSENTLKSLKKHDNTIPVKIGDVRQLDYPDSYFKIYYSGGVIEHFEEGPNQVLKEAYRILDKEGILIITVPYINLLRRLRIFFLFKILRKKYINTYDINNRNIIYKAVSSPFKKDECFNGFKFHEYQYSFKEIISIFKKNKFIPISYCRLEFLWGLKELTFFRKYFNRFSRRKNYDSNKIIDSDRKNIDYSLLKRLLIAEDEEIFFGLGKILLFVPRILFANLLLFICKKQEEW